VLRVVGPEESLSSVSLRWVESVIRNMKVTLFDHEDPVYCFGNRLRYEGQASH